MAEDKPPREHHATPRARIRDALSAGSASAHELSSLAGVREKEVAEHLEHIERSLRAKGERLEIDPARCLACGYVFAERRKFTTPSVCPRCRSERIAPPRFAIVHTRE